MGIKLETYDGNGNLISTIDTRLLSDVLEQRLDEVNDYRNNILYSGYNWNGNRYDSDVVAIANVTATLSVVNSGMALPTGFTWRSQDNQNIPMTTNDFKTFALSMFSYGESVYTASWTHKANLQALSTIQDIDNYDITAGWPAN